MCSQEVCGKCEMYESIKQCDSVDMVFQINRSTVTIVAYMPCKKYGKVHVLLLAVPLIKPGCSSYGMFFSCFLFFLKNQRNTFGSKQGEFV